MEPLEQNVPMSLEVLEAEICRWSANLTAAEARWLGLLAEFDRRGGWRETGCLSCAAWLAWQTSLDLRTAHEKVRVAHALDAFPELAVQMATGALTYAKIRALTRIANADNVQDLIAFGLAATSNQVERFVTAYRRHEPDSDLAEQNAYAGRGLWVRNEGAVCTIRAEVPVEMGAVILSCIDLFLGDTDLADGLRARRADALLSMASFAVANFGADGELDHPYLATVHLTPDVLDDEPVKREPVDVTTAAADADAAGAAHHADDADEAADAADAAEPVGRRHPGGGVCCVAPGDGLGSDPVSVPRKSARRMLCDAVLRGVRHAEDRVPTVGLDRRVVPSRLKRSLRLRDHGCRFPGCEHQAWVDAHHIVHWLDHGPTRPENLICLCRRHHRLMHEGGWWITGDANRHVWFHAPDGTIITGQPMRADGTDQPVIEHDRSDTDGRCGWWGDTFDLDYTIDVISDNEHLRHRQRTSQHAIT